MASDPTYDDGYRQGIYDLRRFVHTCKTCGKEHELRRVDVRQGLNGPVERWSWEDPTDGHTYKRMLPGDVDHWLSQSWNQILADVKTVRDGE